MNPTPIHGSVNEKGLFTAKNPYKYPSSEWIKWNEDNLGKPQLFCYTPSNVLVTDDEHVEVRKGHRIKTTKGWSVLVEAEHEVYENSNVELQPCYITIPPTEKRSLADEVGRDENMPDIANYIYSKVPTAEDIEWAKEKVQQIKSSIPEAQPLEGVKTMDEKPVKEFEKIKQAAELFSTNGLHEFHSPAYQGFIAGVQWREENAQFATDAGGREDIEAMAQKEFPDFNTIGDKNCGLSYNDLRSLQQSSYVHGYKAALSAPSTHSSSEMVIDTEKSIEALRYAAIYFKVELEEDKNLSGAYECLCKIESVLGYEVKAGHDPL